MLMFGWQGETEHDNLSVSAHAETLVDDFRVGGIILLGRNVKTPEQVAATLNEMQARSALPLFIAADQEGGLITRFKHPFTVFPGNMALGATRSAQYCRDAAMVTAREIAAVGVNVNFAPSLDVNINPLNPIIGVRSYGESPELVTELGVAAVEGYQSAGVLACAKHFPGHGDTSVDTHLALPVIRYDRDRLNAVELRPFGAAVDGGVALVMTTHIAFAALDGDLPATLSEPIITRLLRQEMGYDGLVITDCLEMKAIADNYGTADAAVLAVNAGVDILLACHTLEVQAELREALIRAVETGVISEQRIDKSVERILAFKRKYELESRRTVDLDTMNALIGTENNRQLERDIAASAVTLVRDEDSILPLRVQSGDQILVAGMHPATEQFAAAIRRHHANTRHLRISTQPTDEEVSEIRALIKQSAITLLTTFPTEPWTHGLVNEEEQAHLVNRVLLNGAPAIVVAAREPYNLRHFPGVRTCLATYGYPNVTTEAVADLIFGKIGPAGRLPVTIPGCADYGSGLQGF